MQTYVSPFVERYSSKEMLYNFSNDKKYRTWRKLWIALARSQMKLGLPIKPEQVKELQSQADDIDYERVRFWEKRTRHDVMAHIKAYGEKCPVAAGIIHLGATSAYVGDNTDLIVMKDALLIIKKYLVNILNILSKLAYKLKDIPQIAYTHFQPAQLTTIGKRFSIWLNDLVIDMEYLDFVLENLRFLGAKGTVGTQASFMELFNFDEKKVKKLDELIAKEFKFKDAYQVTGQTYPRKIDSIVMGLLSCITQSAHKFATDLRLLQHLKEIQEPFGSEQVGSSAMPYKQNPVLAERIVSLSRFVISLYQNQAFTAASQWFERTLDDSAGKRIAIPEAFLATDAILLIYLSILKDIIINQGVIKKNVAMHFPFIATENIMMKASLLAGDRQKLHEKLRRFSVEASRSIANGKENNLIDRLKNDREFKKVLSKNPGLLRVQNYLGRAPAQVEQFIRTRVKPLIKQNKRLLGIKASIDV